MEVVWDGGGSETGEDEMGIVLMGAAVGKDSVSSKGIIGTVPSAFGFGISSGSAGEGGICCGLV